MAIASSEGRAQVAEPGRATLRQVARAGPPDRQSQVARSPESNRQGRITRVEPPAPVRQSQSARAESRWLPRRTRAPEPEEESCEAEAWMACAEAAWERCRPRVHVPGVIATPRRISPDHYGLGLHLAQWPAETPRGRVVYVSIRTEPGELRRRLDQAGEAPLVDDAYEGGGPSYSPPG